jgi:chromosome segregation ATPase
MYQPLVKTGEIEAIKHQIDLLDKNVKGAEERKARLEEELKIKRQEAAELKLKKDEMSKNYFKLMDNLNRKETFELASLVRERGKCYSALQVANQEKRSARNMLNNAISRVRQIDGQVETAEKSVITAQTAYNEALAKSSVTQLYYGQKNAEQIEGEKYKQMLEGFRRAVEQAQNRLDTLLKQQDVAKLDELEAQGNYEQAETKFFFAETDYQNARAKVEQCEDEVAKLRFDTESIKLRLDDITARYLQTEGRVTALNINEVPRAAGQLMQLQNLAAATRPKLEEQLRQQLAKAKQGGGYRPSAF